MDIPIHRLQGLADLPHVLSHYDVQNVVICPGSRNAPIINALVSSQKFNCTSLIDERSAAYFAMGMAQQSKKPVVITCTSGTAALNFAPALCEAYYMGIPLVAITADRPTEWLDQADNQTIDQTGIYSNFIKFQVTLPSETHHKDELWFYHRKSSEALMNCLVGKPGPVHINLPLREPLYQALPLPSKNIQIVQKFASHKMALGNVDVWMNKWTTSKKRMVILGMDQGNEDLEALLSNLSVKQNTVVLTENISNVGNHGFIDNLENLFATIPKEEENKYKPDLLITIGDSLVCKRLKLFLRENPSKEHWHFSKDAAFTDTYQQLTKVFDFDPYDFLRTITKDQTESDNKFNDIYKKLHLQTIATVFENINQFEFSDLIAIYSILENIPKDWHLHLSNSSVIRLAQIFPTRYDLKYFCNRGTSGIDGSLSTAIGSCAANKTPTLFLGGDLSFVYDSNGLWNNTLPSNFKIIILNNEGGNIFQMIKTGETYQTISPFQETKHNASLQKIAETFNIQHIAVANIKELAHQLDLFFKLEGCALMEVRTNMATNTKVFKELYAKFTF